MALVELNPMFERNSGRMGKIVHYNRRGTQCARRFVVPRNPDTAAQRVIRGSFREAVHAWQALPEAEKAQWNFRTRYKTMTGYNLFVSRYMKGACLAMTEGSSGAQPAFPSYPAANQQRFPSVVHSIEQVYNAGIVPDGPGKG